MTEERLCSKQKKSGRRLIRRDRTAVYRRNQKLEMRVDALQRTIWKLWKRSYRKSKTVSPSSKSPRSKVSAVIKGQFVSNKVRRELFKGAVLEKEIQSSCKKLGNRFTTEKIFFSKIVQGRILKKYKLLYHFKKVLPLDAMLSSRKDEN